jgi:RNA polymerase sigma-70 factor, ECF subfamily
MGKSYFIDWKSPREYIWHERKGSNLQKISVLMATPSSGTNVTDLLVDWSKGDPEALNKLMPLVYDELHRLASRHLRRERRGHTLQTSALVHEAYLKLVDQKNANWQNRVQFFAAAAQVMRHILVDYARNRRALKRGGDSCRLSLDEAIISSEEKDPDLLTLHDALNDLAAIDPQQSRVVELRVFGGLTVEETAEALGISTRTVKREWSMAKAWLHKQMSNH